MKAIQVKQVGGPEALELVDLPTPQPKPNEVVVKIAASGVNFIDVYYREGRYKAVMPFVPGQEAAGDVVAVGSNVTNLKVGDRVAYTMVLGSYADRVGRKPAMMASMMLMGLGILLLTLTPGYATIGYAAPVIAVIARMIQGFAVGGEVGSATIYMMESALPERRGWTMSWQGGSQGIAATVGALVGVLLSLTMSDVVFSAYGWRIALLLGIAIAATTIAPSPMIRPGDTSRVRAISSRVSHSSRTAPRSRRPRTRCRPDVRRHGSIRTAGVKLRRASNSWRAHSSLPASTSCWASASRSSTRSSTSRAAYSSHGSGSGRVDQSAAECSFFIR